MHCVCMRESVWMSERASLSMSWVQRTKASLAWSCSLERGRRERQRGREEPVGILSFLRGRCLDATSWHTHRPKPRPTPTASNPHSNRSKINLYTNRLLIIITPSSSWCSLKAQRSVNNSTFVVLFCLLVLLIVIAINSGNSIHLIMWAANMSLTQTACRSLFMECISKSLYSNAAH